ncbi:STAS domain-containing protein [Gilvimarinus sp. SDUM040013]|uniref:STAS domain-containing protein n=1 Tax=Gilvimarinus gilvus TaxID=3058038 RepID=A0ABU4RWJ6_9GAMM|nr:STAS domain-containing protein [Gilvimarinus sp. SDUM040013]MDO3385272.1 STAS domain-containing protein [Gilvimarinus sp. SDUM040013]MDX6849255.1 STAS domain-containing protein [Gilvimarinus sp. SDUM040013]
MKKQVPFVGEDFFDRDSDNAAFSDETQMLDDLLDAELKSSSWDDIVPAESKGRKTKARASITIPASQKPIKPGTTIDWRPVNHGHCIRINIHGDMDIQMMKQWRQLLKETADNGIHQFEFDLRDTECMSLAGLAMLLLFKDSKQAGSRDIALNQCNRELYKRLLWSGLTEEFIVRPSQEP